MLTKEQIEERKLYIGGSEAAAVLGLSRWATPLQVWALKTGHIQPEDISERIPVKLGNKLEQTVAELFTEETGKRVMRANKTFRHELYPFLGANLDRVVVGEDAILECKTASGWKAKEWSGEDIPQEYLVQVMHYLAVTGASHGYIAVLIGNETFKWRKVERDEQVIKALIDKERIFWNNFVITGEPPAPSANDSDTLYKLYPNVTSKDPIELDDETNMLIERIQSMQQDAMGLEESIEQHRNLIKAKLGDNELGQTGLYKVSWKEQETRRIDTTLLKDEKPELYHQYSKTSRTRVLRYSQLITKGATK